MTKERLYLYDTTLRDGQQTQGVQFSTPEKRQIAETLDALGVDYIEGGWPGANPTDSEFFDAAPDTRARLTAFGMTKRAGRSAENDDVLAAVMNAGTASVCLVGKSHDFHVETALGISLDENTENIARSIEHIVGQGREALFDAEHFFDGYKSNPDYALETVKAAHAAGARWVVLCDTNGGTLAAGHSRDHPGRDRGGHSRRPILAFTPITTPKTPWRAALRPSTRARGRYRARLTGWANAVAMPT